MLLFIGAKHAKQNEEMDVERHWKNLLNENWTEFKVKLFLHGVFYFVEEITIKIFPVFDNNV